MSDARPVNTTDLQELAMVFLKLGTTAFGGPAAHIEMMEQEFVRKRPWLCREEFLDDRLNHRKSPNRSTPPAFRTRCWEVCS